MQRRLRSFSIILSLSGVVPASVCTSCRKEAETTTTEPRLIVYCSVDEPFARAVLARFTRQTGIAVQPVFDTEAGKTTGLVNRIIAEDKSGRTRADVFWSSEVFNTVLLARRGLLTAYESPAAADVPAHFKDVEHRWTGTAVRARVLALSPDLPADKAPRTWQDVGSETLAARVAIANPLFGTTRGHVAAMFALWGPDRAKSFLRSLRDRGALLLDSNSATVRAVISDRADFAATDSDDVEAARKGGASLGIAYPDMGDGGTLLIPCTVAMLKGRMNEASSRRLVDFLVSAEVERMLAESDSRNVPVRAWLRDSLGIALPPGSRVSFDAVADAMDEAEAAVREILLR